MQPTQGEAMTDVLTGRKTIALVAHDNCKADLVE
jgi:hypothetical protein